MPVRVTTAASVVVERRRFGSCADSNRSGRIEAPEVLQASRELCRFDPVKIAKVKPRLFPLQHDQLLA
jgi:hypothetical protein